VQHYKAIQRILIAKWNALGAAALRDA